ncbi:MAG: RNA-dependent ATPase rok1 [Thelocarpon superellum]|nr:MAG: RNA-dependent ATPase rok1 [Thelocarpon superellum]
MDVFKLLSRATKRTRPAPSSDVPAEHLPSKGQTARPQLFGDDRHGEGKLVPSTDTLKGRKRKRGVRFEQSPDVPRELDFFNEQSPSAPPAPTPWQERHVEETAAPPTAAIRLSTEESKKILQAHKLKITVIANSSDRPDRRSQQPVERSKRQQKQQSRIHPQPLTSFDQLRARYDISKRLAANVREQGYQVPTEVQMGSLPLLMQAHDADEDEDGKTLSHELDLLAVAPTGSGKTLAFLLPLLDSLLRQRHQQGQSGDEKASQDVTAVVIAPTKELAAQIVNEGIKITGMQKGMEVGTQNGERSEQESKSESDGDDDGEETSQRPHVKADILVSTPLLLLNSLQHPKDGHSLSTVRHLVLDEADVLLDPLFRDQTLGIWTACTNATLRVSLWSATMGSNIEALAKDTIMARRSKLGPSSSSSWRLVRLVVGLKDSAVPNISHRLIYTATEAGKLLGLRQLMHSSSSNTNTPALRPPFLVFTQTIPRARALHSELLYDIPPQAGGSSRIAVLHASLSDTARADTMARFRTGSIWILITTDLLARGVDFRGLNAVVNYDIPSSSAAYVHRVGRTGRAGREGGVAVTFYTNEDISCVRDIASVIAASEAMKTKNSGRNTTAAAATARLTSSIQPWLLSALPKPSKNERKALKRGGIAERRQSGGKGFHDGDDGDEEGDESRERKGGGGGGEGRGEDKRKEDAKKVKARMRISTKSGFERRLDQKRRSFLSRRRRRDDYVHGHGEGGGGGQEGRDGSGDEWAGIDS